MSEPSSPGDRRCTCGCAAEVHMGRPTGCRTHGLHEFESAGCEHPSYEHLGSTSGADTNVVHRKREDCGERFSVELPDDTTDCRCGHIRFRHQYQAENGPCSKPDCECAKYLPVTVEDVQPKGCTSANGCAYLLTKDCEHGCREAVEELTRLGQEMELPPPEGPEYRPCMACGHIEPEHAPNEGHCTADPRCGCAVYRPAAEPEGCDHACDCGHAAEDHSSSGYCKQCDCEQSDGHYPDDCPEREPEDIEAWPCGDCGAMVPGGLDWCEQPDCQEKARERLAAEAPPQPERRPPYAVAYSVGGHLYEAYLPGDATVVAVDGGLVIKHTDPVIGIVQVQPVRTES